MGEWATASISYGKGSSITNIKELHFPHSVGLLYSAFTYFLGFTVNSGEYKLMGLAPYGIPGSAEVEQFIKIIREKLVDIKEDGSVWLNQNYFNYSTGLRMVKDSLWKELFGFGRRQPESKIEQHHSNLALAIQQVTEEIVLKMAAEAKKLTNCDYLCMAGGVALNCVANGKLLRSGIFKNIFIQPAAGDAGGTGAARRTAQGKRQPVPPQRGALPGEGAAGGGAVAARAAARADPGCLPQPATARRGRCAERPAGLRPV